MTTTYEAVALGVERDHAPQFLVATAVFVVIPSEARDLSF